MIRRTCRVVVGQACIEGVTRLSLLHLLLSSPLGNATTRCKAVVVKNTLAECRVCILQVYS